MIVLQVITVLVTAVAMTMALAHALEYPGKMRLSKESYFTTQSIYYPGFTIGGFAEPLGIAASLALTFALPRGSPPFWWSLFGFSALTAMHVVFWIVTQPVNRYWTAGMRLPTAAQHFFLAAQKPPGPSNFPEGQWERLRSRWEYSHIFRAVLATMGLLCVTVAIVLYGRGGAN